MDQAQDQQPRGDFVAFMNRNKAPGDTRPMFEGRLTLPGSDARRTFALWGHEYPDGKTGEVKVMFSGAADAVAVGAAPMDQVASLLRDAGGTGEQPTVSGLTLKARQLVLFPNAFKNEPTKDGAEPKDRPDYWGAFSPADGSPIVRLSVWMKTDRYGRAYLSGATGYPLPEQSESRHQMTDPALEDGIASSRGRKGRGKSGVEERA